MSAETPVEGGAGAGGYVTDLSYPEMFHRETSPVWIAATVAAIGQKAPAIDRPFRYLDLGCGTGLGVALLAAANPRGAFVGVDINPRHIARGRALAEALPNLTLVEAGFEQLAGQADDGQAPFDFIVLHGVYSWISPARRAAVRRILDRRLAPGGLAYVHYTTHPGQSAFAGAQAMLRRIADVTPGGSQAKLANALACLRALDKGGAGYLRANPDIARLVRGDDEDAAYLAHDLLAPDWAALHVGDVIEEMAETGCAFIGSATVLENIDALSIPGAALPVIARIGDVKARETARDLARNQSLRRDLYRKGLAGLAPEAYRVQLESLRYSALPAMAAFGTLTVDTRIGPVSVDASLIDPIRERLRSGPARFRELMALPAVAGQPAMLLRALQMLTAAGEIHGASDEQADADAAHRLNRILAGKERQRGWLAAPGVGSAVAVDGAGLAVAAALLDDPSLRRAALARAVGERRAGIDSDIVARIEQEMLPRWLELGVLPA